MRHVMRQDLVDVARLTPQHLSLILAERGILPCGTVQDIRMVQVHESFTARVAFLTIAYSADAPPTAPTRLVMKQYLAAVRHTWGKKEVRFYTRLVPTVATLPIAPCYDAYSDPQHDVCYCLLADVADPVRAQELPLTTRLERATTALAQLHAAFWNHPFVCGPLLQETVDIFVDDCTAHPQRHAELIARFGTRIPPRWNAILSTFVAQAEDRLGTYLRTCSSLTLWHSDAHLGNFVFAAARPDVTLVDFAIYRAWPGVRDIAFLLTFTLEPPQRRTIERHILHQYYAQLHHYGVTAYTWEECWEAYRWAVVANLRVPLGSRNRPSAWERLERAVTAYEDIQGDSLLNSKEHF